MTHQLRDLRRRIEALATPDGGFRLGCARTGERPVPAADLRFEDRASADRAARLTRAYRARLREWDPRTPAYDVAVRRRGPDAPVGADDAAPANTANCGCDALGTSPGDAE